MSQTIQRLSGDGRHAQFIDVAHGEDMDAAANDTLAFN